MQAYFNTLMDKTLSLLQGNEFLLAAFAGEDSDFVRLNQNRIRQAGNVRQMSLTLDLIEAQHHTKQSCDLIGDLELDIAQMKTLIAQLRELRAYVPEDPYLHYATEVHSSEQLATNELVASDDAVSTIIDAAQGLDLVGIWARGEMVWGFANSAGQRNWHSSRNFNFDWSVYHNQDKAVKMGYAGFDWQVQALNDKMTSAKTQLAHMRQPPKTLTPGKYRVYLAPSALLELLEVLTWSGFGIKSHRSSHTPLIKMIKEDKTLHPSIDLREHQANGIDASFTDEGFMRPKQVNLIEKGQYRDCLVSARSAKEFNLPANANQHESPVSIELAPGTLVRDDILKTLDTGIYINNLWYCNFSDHDACRITGMTRYACFWVEKGEIKAPINVMRFDESLYHFLNTKLVGLTQEREFIFDPASYYARSNGSAYLPGALIDDFTLTL